MNDKITVKIKGLIEEMPSLIKNFDYSSYNHGPSLYFYERTNDEVKKNKNSLENLLSNDQFIELIYATLTSWGMDSRGAKMKAFDEFRKTILDNKQKFLELSKYRLEDISTKEMKDVENKLQNLFDNLHVMESKSELVANSKIMHFILPDLVMPMDRTNTLQFFYENSNIYNPKAKFLEVFEASWMIAKGMIAKEMNLKSYVSEKGLYRSIPKVIDGAIIAIKK